MGRRTGVLSPVVGSGVLLITELLTTSCSPKTIWYEVHLERLLTSNSTVSLRSQTNQKS